LKRLENRIIDFSFRGRGGTVRSGIKQNWQRELSDEASSDFSNR
jgi:hypothetical protein